MIPEVNLTVFDDSGNTRKVQVHSKRFSIGRTPDNDLIIEHSSLSRRHAVLENFDGHVQITDCGSQNGTEVNRKSIVPCAFLQDGDLITLGGVCDIEVSIANGPHTPAPAKSASGIAAAAAKGQPSVTIRQAPGTAGSTSWLGTTTGQVVLIVVGLCVIVVSIGLLLFVISRVGPTRNSNLTQRNLSNINGDSRSNFPTPEADASPESSVAEAGDGRNRQVASDKVETAAASVIRRLSSDDKTYSFSEKTLADVNRKIEQLQASSTLTGNLVALERSSAQLSASARQQGIEPGLLMYVVLANQEASRSVSDPHGIAQNSIGDLLGLRATFGTNDADSSLIVLAAYKMGRGEKRSHPLLATIRHLVKNPLTQRNVWFLYDHSGLDAPAYDYVITVIALGVISQDPGQFGIQAPPLLF